MVYESKTEESVEGVLADLMGGPFTRLLGSAGRFVGAAHLDAALDLVDRPSIRRRDAAARSLVRIARHGDERAQAELVRLLASGPPHVRVALTFALPETVEWAVFEAAWRGTQRAFYRGSALSERRLRDATVVFAILGVLGLFSFLWSTGENVGLAKLVASWVVWFAFGMAALSAIPAILVWLRFPCRYERLVGYQATVADLLRSALVRDERPCLRLLPEAASMAQMWNTQDTYFLREFEETVAMMRDAARNRPSLPIPAESAATLRTQLPIPDTTPK